MSDRWMLEGTKHILTQEEVETRWYGRDPKYFRCGICNKRFTACDEIRSLYTNYTACKATGNPIVCAEHGEPDACIAELEKRIETVSRETDFVLRAARRPVE